MTSVTRVVNQRDIWFWNEYF